MGILKLVLWPSAVLKKVSQPVDFKDDNLDKLASDMFETMSYHNGVGLSAIQVGVPIRLVVSIFAEPMYNPVISAWTVYKDSLQEGCLSLPGFFETVTRHQGVQVTWTNLQKQVITESFSGLAAQCFQHEVEHLDGHFFTDRLSAARRSTIRGQIQKLRRTGKYPPPGSF